MTLVTKVVTIQAKRIEKIRDGLSKYPEVADALEIPNENLEEKYELYHKTFSDAMQHAYDYAKKKLGITVDPKEIDKKSQPFKETF